jgi:multicomponent Na+:H+ antiporter subunit D
MSDLPPGLLMIIGGLLVMALPVRWRSLVCVLVPLLSAGHMVWAIPNETVSQWAVMDLTLIPLRADRLAHVFGLIFHFAALMATVYSFHQRNRWEQSMGLVYAGSAIAAVFAGDLLTLFVFWELTTLSSALLVWAGHSTSAYRAGLRYLIIQVASGVLLLAGAIFYGAANGTLSFGGVGQIGVLAHPGSDLSALLLLLAFGIKAAFPLLHAWVPDAYPQATPGGTVFLSVFTTKLAIYALIRGFAGCDLLIPIGCVMAIAPLVYALIEDDVRRALAYCLVNQLGYMVVATGVGSELAVNGAAAHAVAHILYKGLLFMATGAVLYRTGTAKASQLGGLAVAMRWVFVWYVLGAAAISAPLFGGSVTKSLSITAVAQAHHQAAWITLMVATAGVFLVCALRIPADVFLGKLRTEPQRARTLPWNMHAAMAATALASSFVGLFPGLLYRQLPFPVDHNPYTLPHVLEQMQTIAFAGLAFVLLVKIRLYPFSAAGSLLDVDWLYRIPLPAAVLLGRRWTQALYPSLRTHVARAATAAWTAMGLQLADDGRRGRFAPTGRMAMAATVMLIIYLLAYYL